MNQLSLRWTPTIAGEGGKEGGREGEASDGMACYADDPLPDSHQGLSQSRAEWSEEESERGALLETRTGPL